MELNHDFWHGDRVTAPCAEMDVGREEGVGENKFMLGKDWGRRRHVVALVRKKQVLCDISFLTHGLVLCMYYIYIYMDLICRREGSSRIRILVDSKFRFVI